MPAQHGLEAKGIGDYALFEFEALNGLCESGREIGLREWIIVLSTYIRYILYYHIFVIYVKINIIDH